VTRHKSSSPNQRRFYLLLVGVVSLAAVTVAFLAWLSETGVGGGTVLEGEAEAQELLAGIQQSGTTLGKEDAPVPSSSTRTSSVPRALSSSGRHLPTSSSATWSLVK
jgi:hypothetical protein